MILLPIVLVYDQNITHSSQPSITVLGLILNTVVTILIRLRIFASLNFTLTPILYVGQNKYNSHLSHKYKVDNTASNVLRHLLLCTNNYVIEN